MANCAKCGNIESKHGCGTVCNNPFQWTDKSPRHPIYDALDAHLEHGDFPDERNTKAATYYLASQIAELMQRIEKLEGRTQD